MSKDMPFAPKGSLVAVGGNEDKEKDLKVLRTIAGLPEGGTNIVEVIPTASSIPREMIEAYQAAFGRIGIREVRGMDIRSRADASKPEYVRRIEEADVVFFTGGDQLRITTLIGGSPVHRAIGGHYWRGGVVAGTSAGAAAMSSTMIFEGDATLSMKKGNVQMTPGLGLLPGGLIDTHFIHRGRLSRLLEVITTNPDLVGLGLSEDTGIIVRNGSFVEAIGAGVVVVVDGHELRYTNLTSISLGQPIAVEHMIIHTLVEGAKYDISGLRYIPPDPPQETPTPEPEKAAAPAAGGGGSGDEEPSPPSA